MHYWKTGCPVVFLVSSGTVPGYSYVVLILESVLSLYLFALYFDDLAKVRIYNRGLFIALYADDVLLLASSIRVTEKLLRVCEKKLDLLDMVINTRKSCCLRI